MIFGVSETSEFLTIHNLVIGLYFLIPANIMLYGINDYFDRDIDEENPKKDEKEESYNSSRLIDSVIALSALTAIPVALSLPQRVYPLMLVFLGLSYQYSAPPLRFKTKPYLDSISNGLYTFPFFITYTWLSGSIPPLSAVIGAWLWTMSMHTFSAIPDIKPDREAGIQTTATYLGRTGAYGYVTAVWILSAAAMTLHSIYLGALFLVYPALTTIVFYMNIDDSRAYWWFPYINGLTGMIIAISGLWVLVHG